MKKLFLLAICLFVSGVVCAETTCKLERLPLCAEQRYLPLGSSSGMVDIPAGTEGVIVDTLSSYRIAVKVGDAVYEVAATRIYDIEGENPYGLTESHLRMGIPAHSFIGRFMYGYGPAFLLFFCLAGVALLFFVFEDWDPMFKVHLILFLMFLATIIEIVWGGILGGSVDWIVDTTAIGWFRSLMNAFGYLVLVGSQFWLAGKTKDLICTAGGADPDEIHFKRLFLLPLPIWFAGLVVIALWLESMFDVLVVVWSFAVLAGVVWSCKRIADKLESPWGRYLVCYILILLVSMLVLIPVTFMVGIFLIMAAVIAVGAAFAISYVGQRHYVIRNGQKVYID